MRVWLWAVSGPLPATLGSYQYALCSWGMAWAAGQQPQGAGGRLPWAVFPNVIVGALWVSSVVAEL